MSAPGSGWLRDWTYAHRGLHDEMRVENSLASFEAAIAAGLGIECDVQADAEGGALVFHDWTLDRLTAARGAVRDISLPELARLSLADGSAIPALRDMLALISARAPVLIEIKSRYGQEWRPVTDAVIAGLAAYRGQAAVMSFDPRVVRRLRKLMPERPFGLCTGRDASLRVGYPLQRAVAIRHARPDFLACDLRDLPDPAIAEMRRRGMLVLGWTARTGELRDRADAWCDAAIAEGEGLA